jgi:CBS domain-containing protein
MKVHEIMTRDVETVRSDETIQLAAQRMRDRRVGALPVADDLRVVGFLTDRDLVVRATAAGRHPEVTRVGDVMSKGVVSCYDEDDVEECARKMEAQRVRRIVVLNTAEHLAGIVSLDDIAARGGRLVLGGQVLEEVGQADPAAGPAGGRSSAAPREGDGATA